MRTRMLTAAVWVCLFFAVLVLLPYCAAATETNVVSVPCAVVRTEIAGTNSALVGICLDLFDCGVNEAFSNQMTGAETQEAADLIRKWDAGAQSFTDAWKWTNGLFYSALPPGATSSLSFLPGDVCVIVSRHSPQTVFIAGSVLLDDSYTNQLAANSNLVTYPFASAIKLNDTALTNLGHGAEQFEYADWLQAWNASSQAWDPVYALRNDSQWRNTNDWSGSPTADLLLLGRGYLYDNVSNSFAWIEGRPYSSSVFPANTNVPYVTGMTLNANKDEITLTIKCAGQPSSEKLEVYYKDSTGLDLFNSTGWLIAATNLATAGQQTRTWVDTGSVSRAKINTVYARYYAIGRADIDSDQDALPDAREILVHGTDPQNPDSDGDGLLDAEEGIRPVKYTWDSAPVLTGRLICERLSTGWAGVQRAA